MDKHNKYAGQKRLELLKIVEIVATLKATPRLYISENEVNFAALKSYLEGLMLGINLLVGINLLWKISLWYQQKINTQSAMYITSQIKYLYPDKSDEELKILLLETIEDYLQQNPNWYNQN